VHNTPDRLDPYAVAELERMAGRSRDALAAAGLPVWTSRDDRRSRSGVWVEVDPLVGGGVFVGWRADASTVARAAVGDGRLDDPAIRCNGQISQVMIEAMATILRLNGITVEEAEDDLRAIQLQVLHTDEGSEADTPGA